MKYDIKLKIANQQCLETLSRDLSEKIGGWTAFVSLKSKTFKADRSESEFMISLFFGAQIVTQECGPELHSLAVESLIKYQEIIDTPKKWVR